MSFNSEKEHIVPEDDSVPFKLFVSEDKVKRGYEIMDYNKSDMDKLIKMIKSDDFDINVKCGNDYGIKTHLLKHKNPRVFFEFYKLQIKKLDEEFIEGMCEIVENLKKENLELQKHTLSPEQINTLKSVLSKI